MTETAPEAALIALRPFQAGGRLLEPGDRVEPRKIAAYDRVKDALANQGFTGPLSRENYARAMRQRPAGVVGAGFTVPGLIAAGILDEPPAAPEAEVIEYRGYGLRKRMAGIAPMYTVLKDGEPALDREIKGLANAKAAVDDLIQET